MKYYLEPNVKIGQQYTVNDANGKYEIIKIDKIEGMIENIVMTNINNRSLKFDVSLYELKKNYQLLN